MRWLKIVLAVTALFFGACGRGAPADERRAPEPLVEVVRSGSQVLAGRVGAAALVRVRGNNPVGPIALKLSFIDGGGAVIDTTDESLPYCDTETPCGWAASFYTEDFTRAGKAVRSVRVSVSNTKRYDNDASVETFEALRAADGEIHANAPGSQGYAYVVALVGAQPRWGISVAVTPETGSSLTIPPDILPALHDEILRGFFYPGPVASGD